MKLIKKLMTTAVLTAAITHLNAQSVSYSIVENDPDKKNLYVHINPFNTQAYMADITIGYNLQATWLASDRFQFQADYRKAYLDGNATGIFSPKGLSKASQLELGGAFNLKHKRKNVLHKIVLKSTSDGRYNYTTSIYVPGEATRIVSIRGGFLSFFSNHKVGNGSGTGDGIIKGKAADGQIRTVHDSVTFETVNFTARSTGFYAGLDLKTLKYLIIDASGYGEKGSKTVNNFYFDVLFTPLVKYDLKPNSGQAIFNNVDINIPDNTRKMLGWRIGWQWVFNKTVGFNAKCEMGQQPGIANKSFFLTLGFGISLGLKTKKLPI